METLDLRPPRHSLCDQPPFLAQQTSALEQPGVDTKESGLTVSWYMATTVRSRLSSSLVHLCTMISEESLFSATSIPTISVYAGGTPPAAKGCCINGTAASSWSSFLAHSELKASGGLLKNQSLAWQFTETHRPMRPPAKQRTNRTQGTRRPTCTGI
jgi:hypothetical protein